MHLLFDNDSRGGHSTGLYVEGEGSNKMYKTVEESGNLNRLIDISKVELAIGHTRYATHGIKTAENTHPYIIGKYIGCHNGVLSNYAETAKKHGFKKPDVDSKSIYETLKTTDDYQTLGEHGGTINAVWTEGDNKLYVYRRNNPLFSLKTDSGIYFSSLEEGLKDLAEEGQEVKEVSANVLKVYENGVLMESIPVPVTYVAPKSAPKALNWDEYRTKDLSQPMTTKDYSQSYYGGYYNEVDSYNASYASNNYASDVKQLDEDELAEAQIKAINKALLVCDSFSIEEEDALYMLLDELYDRQYYGYESYSVEEEEETIKVN
jgi:hypothetical protein